MDAFSLALVYGTQGLDKKNKLILSIIVGIYHFFMPLIGLLLGSYITSKIVINPDLFVGIILSIIAVEMLVSSFKDKEEKFLLSITGYLIFGLSVSIDSLTTGLGLPSISNNYILVSSSFAIMSFLFTFFGLNLGNILNKKYGKISTIIGGTILLILGAIHLFK